MKKILGLAVTLVAILASGAHAEYEAVIKCSNMGRHINSYLCFENTELKVTTNGRSMVYNGATLRTLGTEYRDGFRFRLSDSFKITAQNSAEFAVMEIIVIDESGETVFQDAAGQYGVIRISN